MHQATPTSQLRKIYPLIRNLGMSHATPSFDTVPPTIVHRGAFPTGRRSNGGAAGICTERVRSGEENNGILAGVEHSWLLDVVGTLAT